MLTPSLQPALKHQIHFPYCFYLLDTVQHVLTCSPSDGFRSGCHAMPCCHFYQRLHLLKSSCQLVLAAFDHSCPLLRTRVLFGVWLAETIYFFCFPFIVVAPHQIRVKSPILFDFLLVVSSIYLFAIHSLLFSVPPLSWSPFPVRLDPISIRRQKLASRFTPRTPHHTTSHHTDRHSNLLPPCAPDQNITFWKFRHSFSFAD